MFINITEVVWKKNNKDNKGSLQFLIEIYY